MPLSTTVCLSALAATPAISAVLLTRPSIAPKLAALNQPPETSLWVWSNSCGSPVAAPGDGNSASDDVMTTIQPLQCRADLFR